jgi:hypothetical protein
VPDFAIPESPCRSIGDVDPGVAVFAISSLSSLKYSPSIDDKTVPHMLGRDMGIDACNWRVGQRTCTVAATGRYQSFHAGKQTRSPDGQSDIGFNTGASLSGAGKLVEKTALVTMHFEIHGSRGIFT